MWLQSMGAEVFGFALEPEAGASLFRCADVASQMVSEIGDIRHLDAVRRSLNAAQPTIVFHLAAQALVRASYEAPLETFQTNIIGTAHVLEAMRDLTSVKAAIIVTTDKCYQNQHSTWGYRETDPLGGSDPYSASKACAELVTAAYQQSFFSGVGLSPRLVTARTGNVIGGGDWSRDRLIPDTLRAFDKGMPVRLRYPNAIRPWQHVLEPLRGYLMLAERLTRDGASLPSTWNFGPATRDSWPVARVVEYLAYESGPSSPWMQDENPAPTETQILRIDTTQAQDVLGWHPVWPLSRALDVIRDWHQRFSRGESARELCIEQIQTYLLDVASTAKLYLTLNRSPSKRI